ncbi:MAG: sulfatase [Planctomycetota bacterium]
MHPLLFMMHLVAYPLLTTAAAAQESQPRPNFVIFLVDDLAWNDLGYSGSDFHHTPNIDRLAAEGMVFSDAYANAANCLPSRAAIMSGQYPPRTGVYTVNPTTRGKRENRRLIPASNNNQLSGDVITLAERLQESGYATAHVGKWHLGRPNTAAGPLAQGFDVNIGGYQRGHPKSYFSPYQNPALDDGPKGEYLTDHLANEAAEFIRDNANKAFFLHYAPYSVHTPIQPRPDLEAKAKARPRGDTHSDAPYAAMVEAIDEALGLVLDTLEELDIADQTLVIFSSDNGGHGTISNPKPLRGSKGTPHEGGTRVPLVVRWTDAIEPGSTSDQPVLLFDLYPTLLDLADIAQPTDQPIDGVSLKPLLTGETTRLPQRSLFWHFPAYLEAYRGMQGDWRATPYSAIRSGRWKLIQQFETDSLELYDLATDEGETTNLIGSHADIAERMLTLLTRWQSETGAPASFQRNPEYRP